MLRRPLHDWVSSSRPGRCSLALSYARCRPLLTRSGAVPKRDAYASGCPRLVLNVRKRWKADIQTDHHASLR